MALNKTTLKQEIKAAFQAGKVKAAQQGATEDEIWDEVCGKIADAVDKYVKAGEIQIKTGEIAVTTAGSATTQTGANTTPIVKKLV